MADKLQSQTDQAPARDLSSEDLEQVTAGTVTSGGIQVLMGDGSVRTFVDAADYVVWRKTNGG